jgi:hypothetical protein
MARTTHRRDAVWRDPGARLPAHPNLVARREPPSLARGTLPEAVTEAAASIAPDRPLVVFHSATLVYLTPDQRDRFGAILAEVARNRALAWVAFEGPGASPAAVASARRAEVWANFGLLSVTRFDQGRRADRLLGRVEMHGRWLEWLEPASAAPPDPS